MLYLAASSSNTTVPDHQSVREWINQLAGESHQEVLAMIANRSYENPITFHIIKSDIF